MSTSAEEADVNDTCVVCGSHCRPESACSYCGAYKQSDGREHAWAANLGVAGCAGVAAFFATVAFTSNWFAAFVVAVLAVLFAQTKVGYWLSVAVLFSCGMFVAWFLIEFSKTYR